MIKNSNFSGLGLLLFLWVGWSLGADSYEYFHYDEYQHLIYSFIINTSTLLYIGHTVAFPSQSKNIWHMGAVFILIFFYCHTVVWLFETGRYGDIIKAIIDFYLIFFLIISLIRDIINLLYPKP